MKYIIELDEIPNTGLFKARGANTLVFDRKGIKNILKPYEEESKVDWSKVAVDTPILVRDFEYSNWLKKHFAKFESGKVYTWRGGGTSWNSNDKTDGWKYAILAEAGEQK